MSELAKFDPWINDGGPAALVIREYLVPVEGADGVFFPATYAPQQGADRDERKFQGGYNIDVFPDGTNVCLVDSVGSQANRIEPLFMEAGYANLVPQLFVTFPPKGLKLSLLLANHRAADAVFRSSPFEERLRHAFTEVLRGNSEPLAKIAPTSLVFGVWDSRDTSAKLPRLVASTIRAFNFKGHTRSANFLTQMTIDLAKLDILPGADSKEGFKNALASRAPGGIQLAAGGSIRRDATLGLAALRRLTVAERDGTQSEERTIKLRRYILGLSLVALTAPAESYLRQGCNLVPDHDQPRQFKVVNSDGSRLDISLAHPEAQTYAAAAAAAFGVGKDDEQPFDAAIAEKAAEKPDKVKGDVVSVDATARTLTLKTGRGKDIKEVGIVTTDTTKFQKGKEDATFETVVTVGAKLDVEVVSGAAVKVAGKP
ncbi:MAG: type I-U CRISPR-associated protein Cas7 [Planctomycetes bacterium]|nr:type I-U CRISPR-associated protein Cas7 [Planctomycetota bacterium]